MLATLAIFGDESRVSYAGGKQSVFRRIVNLMPPHRIYVESHLGGGAVLRAKQPASVNIGIDRDHRVLTRFQHLPANYRFICGDAVEVLESVRPGVDTLIYCDPPYLAHTRRSRRSPYRHDLSEAEHIALLAYLRRVPCAVMVSAYPNELYSQTLSDWHHVTFVAPSRSGPRREVLWMNFAPGGPLHDTRYLGDTFRQREVFARQRQRWTSRLRRMTKPQQQAILSSLLDVFTANLSASELQSIAQCTPNLCSSNNSFPGLPPLSHPFLTPFTESVELSAYHANHR